MKRVRWLLEKVLRALIIVLAGVFGLFTIFGLGVMGLWLSVWNWVLSVLLAAMLLVFARDMVNRKVLRRLCFYVLICLVAAMPIHGISSTLLYQNIAQGITAPNKISYFQNILGKNYTYKELIQWENSSLSWDYSGNTTTITDPIEIYESHKARCGGYAILYAALSVSQGFRCRIVNSIFNDHVWNEVYDNGSWVRIDASPVGHPELGEAEHVGYPLFYEEVWSSPPVLVLTFENSSVTDVTSDYRSDHWSLLSGTTFVFVFIAAWFAVCVPMIWRARTFFKTRKTPYNIV